MLEDELASEKATVAKLKEQLANQNPEIKTVESSSPIKMEEAKVDEKQMAAAGAGFGAGNETWRQTSNGKLCQAQFYCYVL